MTHPVHFCLTNILSRFLLTKIPVKSDITIPSANASIGGSNTQVQFNDSGAFGGDAGLTYDKTTDTLAVGAISGIAGTFLTITAQDSNDVGGDIVNGIEISAGNAISGNNAGGGMDASAGNGFGSGDGGGFQFSGGNGEPSLGTGNGGDVQFYAGDGGGAGGNGGNFILEAGIAQAGNSNGGNVEFRVGAGTGSGTDGKFQFLPVGSIVRGILDFSLIATTDKTFTFPNTSGTFALTGLAGTKVYYVADSSGGAVTRKLTFTDGVLTSEV